MAERVNEQVGSTPVETTDRGLFDFKNKDEEGKPIKEETLASEFDQKFIVSDEDEKKHIGTTQTPTPTPTPVEDTTDHSLFDLIKNDSENQKPVTEETFASEFDQKARVTEPEEHKDDDENKHGTVVQMLRSYNSNSTSSDEEGDDEEKKRRKNEKKETKGITEKLMEKLPGQKDEVAEDTHVPIEKPHVQEVVYSEPPHQEEEPEKKSFLDKIKDKLPGQNKTDDHHDEVVPVSVEPVVKGEEDKKGFLDKIKDKIPGLSSTKASDEKNDHEDK